MQTLTNKCGICEESFPNWVDYQEHLALGHIHKEETQSDGTIKVFSSGRKDLGRGPYPEQRMTDADKRLTVAKGEMRLGLGAFVGHA